MIQNRKYQVSLIIASGAVRFPFVAPSDSHHPLPPPPLLGGCGGSEDMRVPIDSVLSREDGAYPLSVHSILAGVGVSIR